MIDVAHHGHHRCPRFRGSLNDPLCLENAFNAEHIVQALDLSDWIGKVQKYYGKPRRLRARLSWDV